MKFPFFTRPIRVTNKDVALATGLLIILLFICGLAVAIPVAVYVNGQQAEEQYYRALYDTCRSQTGLEELCLRSLANFRQEYGWYELESPGWRWPLPDEVPAGAARSRRAGQIAGE